MSALTATNTSPNQGATTGNNIVTITGSGFSPVPTMQNFGADTCASMPVYPALGSTITLTDYRNNQQYEIRKLADGNCWMVNNLKISLYDVAKPATIAGSKQGINTASLITQTTPNNSGSATYTDPRYYDPGGSPTNTDQDFYGYLYNWCAATGGDPATCTASGTMPTNTNIDICPAGWRLPTGGATGEFAVLNGSLFNNTLSPADTSGNSAHAANFQFTGPFKGVFSGRRSGGSLLYQGSDGLWWSSSRSEGDSYNAHSLYVGSGVVYPDVGVNRVGGLAVRCLAQTGTTATVDKPTVTVDGVTIDPADIDVISDTELRIKKMPAHAAGVVNVVIKLGAETKTVQYEYLADAVVTGPTNPIIPGVPNTGMRQP